MYVCMYMVAGVDFIVVQGAEAGGHRGTFYNTGRFEMTSNVN